MPADHVADRIEIMELVALASRYMDERKPEQWADLFTADGTMVGSTGETKGRDALVALATKMGGGGVHTTNGSTIEIDGDTARHEATVVVFTRAKAGELHHARLVARYEDVLHRTEQGWKLHHRQIIQHYRDA